MVNMVRKIIDNDAILSTKIIVSSLAKQKRKNLQALYRIDKNMYYNTLYHHLLNSLSMSEFL